MAIEVTAHAQDQSDVHIRDDRGRYWCDRCPLFQESGQFTSRDPRVFLRHLRRHRREGHRVPGVAWEYLAARLP